MMRSDSYTRGRERGARQWGPGQLLKSLKVVGSWLGLQQEVLGGDEDDEVALTKRITQ